MKHILFIPSWYPSEELPQLGCFFVEQAQELQKAGYKVGVIHPEVRPLKGLSWPLLRKNRFQLSYSEPFGIPAWRLHGWNLTPMWEKGQMGQWIGACRLLFRRYVATCGRPDLLHAHSLLWGGAAAADLSQREGLPYVVTEHNTNFLEGRPLSRPAGRCWSDPYLARVVGSAALVTAVGGALQKELLRYAAPEQKIEISPNMVAMESFTLAAAPPPTPFRFLTLGGLVKRKNISLLIDAFHCAFGKEDEVELEIGGEGPEEGALKRQAEQLGIASKVRFVGQLSREEVRQAIARSHVFALSSDYDTFGVVLVEAMASGLPVVSTRSGGPQEIVTPETGLLVDKGDCKALANALVEIRENYARYDRQKIRAATAARFGEEAFIERWKQLYTSCL